MEQSVDITLEKEEIAFLRGLCEPMASNTEEVIKGVRDKRKEKLADHPMFKRMMEITEQIGIPELKEMTDKMVEKTISEQDEELRKHAVIARNILTKIRNAKIQNIRNEMRPQSEESVDIRTGE